MSFIVNPYLVKPGTDKITIMFESYCALPKVYYREKRKNDFTALKADFLTVLPTIRKSRLKGLKSNTEYEYYIATPLRKSRIYNFRTWPETNDGAELVKIAAISDTQGDRPERLKDIIVNGIIRNEAGSAPEQAADVLSAILVTGDIVTTGTSKKQWVNDFFKNMDPLISHVPILPALGNHDMIPFLYACYFDLIPDFKENLDESRFYNRADLLNASIITLNSNNVIDIDNVPDYEDSIQSLWLEEQLTDISYNPGIDFLIAQFHHPCKSELWTPGNCSRSCGYVKKFEKFTEYTGKPSFHLFGHTHAYSRGQSRDVKHIWVNVATTAGDIDYWGESSMEDYDEFQKSIDEYGYSILTIKQGRSPSIKFVRRSGGDGIYYNGYTDDTMNDDFTIDYEDIKPLRPALNISVSDNVGLLGSSFTDSDGDTHLETHWQIAKDSNFQAMVKDIWGNKTRCENIWFDDNIQAGTDITKFTVKDLEKNNSYYARVRYRDSRFTWSDWSDPVFFDLK